MTITPGFSTEIVWSAFEAVDDRPAFETAKPEPPPAFLRDDRNYTRIDGFLLTRTTPCANKEWAALPVGFSLLPEADRTPMFCVVCGCRECKPDQQLCTTCAEIFTHSDPGASR